MERVTPAAANPRIGMRDNGAGGDTCAGKELEELVSPWRHPKDTELALGSSGKDLGMGNELLTHEIWGVLGAGTSRGLMGTPGKGIALFRFSHPFSGEIPPGILRPRLAPSTRKDVEQIQRILSPG